MKLITKNENDYKLYNKEEKFKIVNNNNNKITTKLCDSSIINEKENNKIIIIREKRAPTIKKTLEDKQQLEPVKLKILKLRIAGTKARHLKQHIKKVVKHVRGGFKNTLKKRIFHGELFLKKAKKVYSIIEEHNNGTYQIGLFCKCYRLVLNFIYKFGLMFKSNSFPFTLPPFASKWTTRNTLRTTRNYTFVYYTKYRHRRMMLLQQKKMERAIRRQDRNIRRRLSSLLPIKRRKFIKMVHGKKLNPRKDPLGK